MNRLSWSALAFLFAPAALLVAACSSSSSNDAGSACDHYYSALESDRCGSNVHSAKRSAELQASFHDLCVKALAEPGITLGASDLNACASAIEGLACGDPTPDACKFKPGTLSEGAGCLSDSQCASGYCQRGDGASGGGTGTSGADGGTTGTKPAYCGTCVARIPDGGKCGAGVPCVTDDTCDGSKCVPVVKGSEGADCDFSTKQCASGLECSLQTRKCTARLGAGEACVSSTDCQGTLACIGSKCAAKLAEGADCTGSDQCTPPLGCDPSTKKCAAHPIAGQGESCDTFTLCDYGSCEIQSGSGAPKGTCPTVIPAGGACTTDGQTRCDDYYSCIDGKCSTEDANLCK